MIPITVPYYRWVDDQDVAPDVLNWDDSEPSEEKDGFTFAVINTGNGKWKVQQVYEQGFGMCQRPKP